MRVKHKNIMKNQRELSGENRGKANMIHWEYSFHDNLQCFNGLFLFLSILLPGIFNGLGYHDSQVLGQLVNYVFQVAGDRVFRLEQFVDFNIKGSGKFYKG